MNKNLTPQTDTVREERKQVFKKIPGQQDFLPDDFADFESVSERLGTLAKSFGFIRVEPSLFESTDLTQRFGYKSGQTVQFLAGGEHNVAIRPSNLPGLLRMYVESRMSERENISKWHYLAPIISQRDDPYELLSSFEYGFEIVGDESAIFDAQILALAWKLYEVLGSEKIALEIGSRGCEVCWPEYQDVLRRSLSDVKYSLCKDCALAVNKNPEKVLICEQPECQSIAADAPAFIDYLDQNCAEHLTLVLESLDELGVPYMLMPQASAGEHAKRTTFAFRFNHPQDAFILSQGGRHDGLFTHFEHPKRPALGLFGDLGKLLRAWRLSGAQVDKKRKADVVVIPLGDLACKKALSLFSEFWDAQISVVNFLSENSLKLRLQQAQDLKILVALIIGQKEALDDTVILRDVRSGMQEVFPADRILVEVRKRLGE